MATFYAFMALCLSGSAFAQIVTSGRCPKVRLQKDLDVYELVGTWYEYARFSTLYEAGGECGVFNYSIDENTNIPILNHTVFSTITGTEESFENDMLIPNPEEPARMLRKIPRSPIKEYNNVLILGTDYNNWVAVVSCNNVCSMNLQYAWIATRERIPDEDDVASAYAVMKKNNIDTSQLLKMEQGNCRG